MSLLSRHRWPSVVTARPRPAAACAVPLRRAAPVRRASAVAPAPAASAAGAAGSGAGVYLGPIASTNFSSMLSAASLRRLVSVICIDSRGKVSELSMPITQLRDESRLHMRELLIVEQPAALLQPRILPRRHCIVITVGYVRAIVWTDRVYLFSPHVNQVQEYAKILSQHVRHFNAASAGGSMPPPAGNGAQEVHGASSAALAQAAAAANSATAMALAGAQAAGAHHSLDVLVESHDTAHLHAWESTPVSESLAASHAQRGMRDVSRGGGGARAHGGGSAAGSGTASSMRGGGVDDDTTAFEMLVLEHALLSLQARQAKRVAYARRVLQSVLSRMGTVERDDSRLYTLFPLANTLTHYEMVSRGLTDCVRSLLDDERDMREACLTEKARISQRIRNKAAAISRAQAQAFDPGLATTDAASESLMPKVLGQVVHEGADAFLGNVGSPIASMRHVTAVVASNPALKAQIQLERQTLPNFTPRDSAWSSYLWSGMNNVKHGTGDSAHDSAIAALTAHSATATASAAHSGKYSSRAAAIAAATHDASITASAHKAGSSLAYAVPPARRAGMGERDEEEGLSVSQLRRMREEQLSAAHALPEQAHGDDAVPHGDAASESADPYIVHHAYPANDEMGGYAPPAAHPVPPQGAPPQQPSSSAAPRKAAGGNTHANAYAHAGGAGGSAKAGGSNVAEWDSPITLMPQDVEAQYGSEDEVTSAVDSQFPPILRISHEKLSHLELMLESIHHRAAETSMHIVELARTLRNKQDLLELQQSNYRNFILSVSLRMSIVTVAISMGTFITSAFGMNLPSGVEDTPFFFYVATTASAGLAAYVYRKVDRLTLVSSPTQQYARRLQTFQDFLYKLDSKMDAAKMVAAGGASGMAPPAFAHQRPGPDAMREAIARNPNRFWTNEFGFSSSTSSSSELDDADFSEAAAADAAADPRNGLSRAEFKKLYGKISTAASEEEVDLLFDMLDTDGDNKIKMEELMGMDVLSPGRTTSGGFKGNTDSVL